MRAILNQDSCLLTRCSTPSLQNVYFNYVLLVRALARAGDYLTTFNLKPGHGIPTSERLTLSLLQSLVSQASSCPPTFDEATMFQPSNPAAPQLKREFRDHFRNVSAIMDCVGCDKCRLWGKMQVNGLGTAMKILFSYEEGDFDPRRNPALLERSELVALINTLHRFAESLKAVETFREMYQRQVREGKSEEKETVKKDEKKEAASRPASSKVGEGRGSPSGHHKKPIDDARPAFSLHAILEAAKGHLTEAVEMCRTSATACVSWCRRRIEGWRGHGLASQSSTEL